MDRLPAEILEKILEATNDGTRYKADLAVFSLVSRKWNVAATPSLFRVVTVDIVVRDRQVAAVRAIDPSLRHVQTLMTLYTFLILNPALVSHIRFLQLRIAIQDRTSGSHELRNASHGVDPQSLCAILSAVPNLRHLTLQDVFTSRPLRSADMGLAPSLTSVTCSFLRCWTRFIADGIDLLDVVRLFTTVDALGVASIVAGDRHSHRPPQPANSCRPLPCSTLVIGDTMAPQYVFEFIAPSSCTLTTLMLNVVETATLLWLPSVLDQLAPRLTRFAVSILPSTLINVSGGDYSMFDFLSRRCWRNLEELHVDFHTLIRGEDTCRTWSVLLYMMRPLQPSSFPSLKQLFLCGGAQAPGRLVPVEQMPNSLSRNFKSGQEKLLQLAVDASFRRLTIVVLSPSNTAPADPTEQNFGSIASFEQLFASLKERNLLNVQLIQENGLARSMVNKHGFASDGS